MSIKLIKLFIKLKNASILKKKYIIVKYSKFYLNFLNILYNEGFIQSINHDYKLSLLKIELKYCYNKSILKTLTFFSVPSKKTYLSAFNLNKINDFKSLTIISTNQGIYTLNECKKKHIGGTLLFKCN